MKRSIIFVILTLLVVVQSVYPAGSNTVKPDVMIVFPANNSAVFGTVTIQLLINGNVAKVEFYIDAIKIAEATSHPYEYSWNTDKLAHGSVHTIQVKAYDDAGNVGTSATVSVTVVDPNAPVVFTDPGLEKAVRSALQIPSNQSVTRADMAKLTTFIARNKNIQSLSGLEWAINLKELRLVKNQISNLSQLAKLTKLKWIALNGNQIIDISPLANLIDLHSIDLSDNQIGDISPLANLVNLEWIDLSNNKISDIGPLTELVNLKWVLLNNNQISDISPLVNNTGLGKGKIVELKNNPLDLSPGSDDMQNIETLKNRGVTVSY
ncbi:leucine-rich repeat domain-containing protein [Pseudothermotoga sp. U03pept]|uniref:leucine-rich repeat domain-containing protein n=1 Tax=Pseudothermotoga sp. U03pept TaxID=3447012 RepID=UPI003F044814